MTFPFQIACFSLVALTVPLAAYHFWDEYVEAFETFGNISVQICSAKKIPCPRLSVADFFGSSWQCHCYRRSIPLDRKKYWLDTLFVCTIMQFGGTTCTGLLLGQSPSWLSSSTAWPSLFVCWWLTFFCPYDAWFHLLQHDFFKFLVLPGVWASSAHAVTSWGMDKALSADHLKAQNSALVALATGTISACGGGILTDMFGLQKSEWELKRPDCLEAPSQPIEKAFVCALLYYVLIDPHNFIWQAGFALDVREARSLIGIAMFELNLCLYLFPSTRVTEVFGAAAGRLFNMSTYVSECGFSDDLISPKKAN